MKNLLYIFTSLAFIFLFSCKEKDITTKMVKIPDVNFEKALIAQKIDSDNTINGLLKTDDALKVNQLDIGVEGTSGLIKDLTGIETFLNLTELDCSFNVLTNLNISKNTSLITLNCSNNDLTSLDVSKNANLKILSCSKNKLTSFDVSKNVNLQFLSCDNNLISSLDVSKNIKLNEFTCNNNLLKSLDISKNIRIQFLYCFNNELTSLDVSTIVSLFNLSCSNNKISTICVGDVEKAKAQKYWYKDNSANYKLCK